MSYQVYIRQNQHIICLNEMECINVGALNQQYCYHGGDRNPNAAGTSLFLLQHNINSGIKIIFV